MPSALDRVVLLLKSDDHSLRSLAHLSGRDTFRFYNSANLRDLDLSNQDLTGLNFDNADVRSSNLTGAIYDIGSFNNAILDIDQLWIKDDFEYSIDDIIDFPSKNLLVFCRIRPGLVDTLLAVIGISYTRFSEKSGVSLNAIRKGRNGHIVSLDTCLSVLMELKVLIRDSPLDTYAKYISMIEQPCVAFMVGGNNAPFATLTKADLDKVLAIRTARDITYPGRYNNYAQQARDTVEYLMHFAFLLNRD